MKYRCQQDLVYAAEEALPRGREFRSLAELQRWVDDLRETWWWDARYARVKRIEVGPAIRRKGARSVGWWDRDMLAGRIEMHPFHRNVRDVTHEIAHVIAEALHNSEAHDPWFCREYLNLTYLISGQVWQDLAHAFEQHDVDYHREV
jgi:hypothetical protein